MKKYIVCFFAWKNCFVYETVDSEINGGCDPTGSKPAIKRYPAGLSVKGKFWDHFFFKFKRGKFSNRFDLNLYWRHITQAENQRRKICPLLGGWGLEGSQALKVERAELINRTQVGRRTSLLGWKTKKLNIVEKAELIIENQIMRKFI